MGVNNTYFAVGSWIPALRNLEFDTIDGLLNTDAICFEKLSVKITFQQLKEDEIDKVSINFIKNNAEVANITDIKFLKIKIMNGVYMKSSKIRKLNRYSSPSVIKKDDYELLLKFRDIGIVDFGFDDQTNTMLAVIKDSYKQYFE